MAGQKVEKAAMSLHSIWKTRVGSGDRTLYKEGQGLLIHDLSSIILIAKRWKQPKCSLTNERINKMWCIYDSEILFSLKKERNPDTYYDIHEPWRHVKWNKPITKTKGLYNYTYMKYIESRMMVAMGWGRGAMERYCLRQRSPSFLDPETSFTEDSFSLDQDWGWWFGDDSSTFHLWHTLFLLLLH